MQRLHLTGALQRTLRSTNIVANLNGNVERYTRNVKRWRGGHMIRRWVASALVEAEKHFRRVRGYRPQWTGQNRPVCPSGHTAEQLSVGGAAATGRRWQCVHRAGDRKLDWTKLPSAVGLLWALHCGRTALSGSGRGSGRRLPGAGGRRRWPRRWSCNPPRGSQTQVDRLGDPGSSGSTRGGRLCACHDESRMAGHTQTPTGWSIGCLLPAWQRGHWRKERPVSSS